MGSRGGGNAFGEHMENEDHGLWPQSGPSDNIWKKSLSRPSDRCWKMSSFAVAICVGYTRSAVGSKVAYAL